MEPHERLISAVSPHSYGELTCDGEQYGCMLLRVTKQNAGMPWYVEGRADSTLWKTI